MYSYHQIVPYCRSFQIVPCETRCEDLTQFNNDTEIHYDDNIVMIVIMRH